MKRSPKNKIYILLMILVSLGLNVYCGLLNIDDVFFTVISLILIAGAIGLCVYEVYEKLKFNENKAHELDKINSENFSDATQVSVLTSENIFINEFDEEPTKPSKDDFLDTIDRCDDDMAYVDKNLDFSSACADLKEFAKGLGCIISDETAKCLFSSLAASRLVITEHVNSEIFHKLISVLSSYFETDTYFETVNENITKEEDLLFSTDPSGNKIPTSLHRAILHAAQSRDKIFIVAYDEVSLSNISNYFIPCAQYIENPFLNNGFSATNAQNIKTQYKIPPNVWFVLNLNSNESIAHIPGYMGDRASFIRTEIGLADSNDMILPTITKRINYYQLNFLIEKNKKQYQIDEVDWKKIDRLESYISSRINYSFENKLCTSIESFSSVYLSCGDDKSKALDQCIASKLIPAIIPRIMKSPDPVKSDFAEAFNDIFGEGELPICRKALIACIHIAK